METTVMIGEKPKVASKLANALGNYSIEENRGVKNYVLETDNRKIIIAPAVGHIFNLKQVEEGWEYPVFDVEWAPTFETTEDADYMKKYYNNLKDQLEKADSFINACDYDLEGSVIGANVIKQLTGADNERIQRMKFSTLTPDDLRDAYDGLETFDRGMTEAGITRHILDFYYGINVSRALMKAVRANNRYKTLSTGRVQGPALKVLADKEREIRAFEPDPYWEIYMNHSEFEAQFQDEGGEDRIWDEDAANKVFDAVKDEDQAVVSDISINNYKHKPPIPFNLTGLQSEASSQFNLSPKQTQQIAQTLYENSLISYPRTESQKLPARLGYEELLKKLKGQKEYSDLAQKVLDKKELKPKQGKKKDDAHPAIYPTGESPSGKLSKKEAQVYDLIVKRFLAVFGKAAKRRTLTMTLDVNGYKFSAKSKITVERNWFNLYDPYVRVAEAELPELEKGEVLDVEEFEIMDKETQPPRRYSQSRIVNELEKRNLGTKATRATTIDRLYNRKYIRDDPIEVTELGLAIVDTLEDHSPELMSEELTREFENKMEAIQEGDEDRENVLDKARTELTETLERFRKEQKDIGAEIIEALDKTRFQESLLGPCDKCETGQLRMIKTKKGRFVGCTNYPDCENTYPLPRNGTINAMEKECDTCEKPMIQVNRKKGKNYSMCVDPDCPSKDDW